MKRKDIDIFLIELDKFIGKYKGIISDLDLEVMFCVDFKRTDNIKTLGQGDLKYRLDLKNIIPMINLYSMQRDGKSIKRTDLYLRKVAYGLKYKEINDFSYEDIFLKICYNNGFLKDKYKVISNHGKDITKLPTFIIPESRYHNNDFLINNL